MITSRQLRQKYLDFFASKGHVIIPSAPLSPENDPTILFTTAGMHPLVPFLLGEKHPAGRRLANVQKCARTQDIDEVGDSCHETFFEMLGNWSLGDYFKKEAIEWSWEFLTSAQWLGLEPARIAVSVFAGDADAPRDEESVEIWKELGVPEHKIAYLSKNKNWWGPAGETGPCGPDTEMFYWKGESAYPSPESNPQTDEDNWLEIWNDVFMEYQKKADGSLAPLKQKNVDTGLGLERALVALNNFADVFQADTFWPLIQKIEEISGREYVESNAVTRSMRIVADHLRAAAMIMGDDQRIAPSNVDQGYIARRLIRRAIRHGRLLGIKENFCSRLAGETVKIFAAVYPEVKKNEDFILTEIAKEESKFRNTLEKGIKNFESRIKNLAGGKLSGCEAFGLYQSYGFPLEITMELAREKGVEVDAEGFQKEMKKHQELSRAGAEQKFKGGLADASETTVKYHTATHLLHAALREILGPHAEQRGSNITAERLRFDFSHPEKLTEEQKQKIEDMINKAIVEDWPVACEETTVDKARKKGVLGLFASKYGEKVKVYTIGEAKAPFSREICGGPHVQRTGVLGRFRIIKEEAISAGVRRIKAVLE
ncbi:MAG: alanine--tRNA ligase [Candidatus Magasanikbacteria bacterium]|nr:alanine--tRNA ligase [Candidatus Magasanikbacteria bacterium]